MVFQSFTADFVQPSRTFGKNEEVIDGKKAKSKRQFDFRMPDKW